MPSTRTIKKIGMLASVSLLALWLRGPQIAWAHCDTLDGPVVEDARAALEKGDVTPVLKWVPKDSEPEILPAFQMAMLVRAKGPAARELADRYFFETLVRIHRAGEGAPYTGLKPAGLKSEPGVAEADRALETGEVDELVKAATDLVAAGIRERFRQAAEARKHVNESVEAGREYAGAYVEFVHHVERIFADAGGAAHGHAQAGQMAEPGHERGQRVDRHDHGDHP